MALNIKDGEAERLAGEVAQLAGETKTTAVRVALAERRERLRRRTPTVDRAERIREFLETEIWPQVPASMLGHPIGKAEREAILGYGSEGV